MGKAVRIWGTLDTGEVITGKLSKTLHGVLYLYGKDGDKQVVWLNRQVELKNGKGKDILVFPMQVHHNEKTDVGIKTVVKDKTFKIPVEYTLDIKKLGEIVKQRIPTGRHVLVKKHQIINGKAHCDAVNWEKLTDEQREHLSHIDIWDLHDELVNLLSKGEKGWYVGTLQQIENDLDIWDNYTRVEPETIEVETHKVSGADIKLHIKAGKYEKDLIFNSLGWEDCKGQFIMSAGFILNRPEILIKNLEGNFKILE
jgi:hypothetical protein